MARFSSNVLVSSLCSLLLVLQLQSPLAVSALSFTTFQSQATKDYEPTRQYELVFPPLDTSFEQSAPSKQLQRPSSPQQLLTGMLHRALHHHAGTSLEDLPLKQQRLANGHREHQVSLRRILAPGDWESFNSLFVGATLFIPSVTVQTRAGATLTLNINDPYCVDISLEDIMMTYETDSSGRRFRFKVEIVNLRLTCFSDYSYRWSFFRGSGQIDAYARDNHAETRLTFEQPGGFANGPPDTVNVDYCTAIFDIYDLDFRGGIVNSILNTFERSLRGYLETQLEDVACTELSSLGTVFVQDTLDTFETWVSQHLTPIPSNPLAAERNLVRPANVELIQFGDAPVDGENTLATWFTQLLEQADQFLGANGSGGASSELGINEILRNTMLDEDGSFTLLEENLPPTFDPVLFQSHDAVSETTMTFSQARMWGLDSITRFDPLVDIGDFTLQSSFFWQYLVFEMDLVVSIKPSSLPDSVLVNPNDSVRIHESISISFGVDNLQVGLALLLAVDGEQLGDLGFGALLSNESYMACVAEVIYKLAVAEMTMQVGSIRFPTLDGFISPGIEHIVTSGVDAAFIMLESTFQRALPQLVQGPLVAIVNDAIAASTLFDPALNTCSIYQPSSPTELVDFRSLFLDPINSARLGGSAEEPYGTLTPLMYQLVQEQFAGIDEVTGELTINTVFLRPTSLLQSGTEGVFIVNSTRSFLGNSTTEIHVGMKNITISNLDTVVPPFKLLEPTRTGTTLHNEFNFDLDDRPLAVSVPFFIAVETEQASPWSMDEEVELFVSVGSLSLVADLDVRIRISELLNLPISNVLNGNCWMAIAIIDGFTRSAPPLSFPVIEAEMRDLFFSASVEGTRTGTSYIPELIALWDRVGSVNTILGIRLSTLFSEVLQSEEFEAGLKSRAEKAPLLCPSHPDYDESFSLDDNNDEVTFVFNLSERSIDTFVYAVALVGQILLVVVAENYHDFQQQQLPEQITRRFDHEDSVNLLDWTNVSESLGGNTTSLGSLAELGLERGREWLNAGPENPMFQELIGNFTDENGFLEVEWNNTQFSLPGNVSASISSLRILGLESLTSVNVLDPLDETTLRNVMAFDEFVVEVTVTVQSVDHQRNVTFAFSLADVTIGVDLELQVDVDAFLDLELSSLLFRQDIVPCLFSAVRLAQVREFSLSLGVLEVPTITGLFPETHASIAELMRTIWGRYGSTISEALPLAFNTTFRAMINEALDSFASNATCPQETDADFANSSGILDFRDLFLDPAESLVLGGSGTMPYGDMGVVLFDFFQQNISSVRDDGSLAINDLLLGNLTQKQSGESGLLYWDTSELFSYSNDELDVEWLGDLLTSAIVSIGNVTVENLDSLVKPLVLLQPTSQLGELANEVNFNVSEGDTLSVGIDVQFAVDGNNSPLAMSGEFFLGFSAQSIRLAADLIALLNATSFLQLPFRHIVDVDCWLSLIIEDDDVISLLESQMAEEAKGLTIRSLVSEIKDLGFQFDLSESSGTAIDTIPTILEILEQSGATEFLTNRLDEVVDSLVNDGILDSMLQGYVEEAKCRCPLTPMDAAESYCDMETNPIELTALSDTAVETGIYGAFLAAQAALVIVGENHRDFYSSSNVPEKLTLDAPPDVELLNWTDVGASIGGGDLPNQALDALRTFINGVDEESQVLRINDVMSRVAANGTLVLQPNQTLTVGPLFIEVSSVTIDGLDTFEFSDILEPSDTFELSNRVLLGRLGLEVTLSLKREDDDTSREIVMAWSASDLFVDMSLVAAFNLTAIRELELGSMLHSEDILPCVLSSAYEIFVSRLFVEVGELSVPVLSGLSDEADQSVMAVSNALFGEFRLTIQESLPFIFATTGRRIINSILETFLSSQVCPERDVSSVDEFVELGYILTSPSDDFGDVPFMLGNALSSELVQGDEKSSIVSFANQMIGRSLSKSDNLLSLLPDSFVSFVTGKLHRIGVDVFDLDLSALSLANLNTIESLFVLKPSDDDPNLLRNGLAFSPKADPMLALFNVFVGFFGDPVLSSRNDVSVELLMGAAEVSADIKVQINARKLLKFPFMSRLSDIGCWTSLLRTPELDSDGLKLAKEESGISVENFLLDVSELSLKAACADELRCTTSGLSALFEVLNQYDIDGITAFVKDFLLNGLNSVAASSLLQTYLDRFLISTSNTCGATDVLSDPMPFPGFETSDLWNQALDLGLFVAGYGFEAAAVTIFKSHEWYSKDPTTEPMEQQEKVAASYPNNTLIDFSDLELSMGEWAESLVNQLRRYLEEETEGEEGPGDLGVNAALRSFLLDETRTMALDLSHVFREFTLDPIFGIYLDGFRIKGLDTISRIEALNFSDPQLLRNSFFMDKVECEMDVQIKAGMGETNGTISLHVDGFEAITSMLIGVEKELVGNLELGRLLDTDRTFTCLLSATPVVSFPELDVSFEDITKFGIEGFHDQKVLEAMEALTGVTLGKFGDLILANMSPFFNYSIKAVLNNWVKYMYTQSDTFHCPPFDASRLLSSREEEYIDFRELLLSESDSLARGGSGLSEYGNLVRNLINITNENVVKVDPETGLSAVNKVVIRSWTKSQSSVAGRLAYPGDIYHTETTIQLGGLEAKVEIRVYDAYINNLDTIGAPLAVIDPVFNEPTLLNNTVRAGLGRPLQVGTHFFFSLSVEDDSIVNDLDLSLSLDSLSLLATVLLQVSKQRFISFPLKDLVSIDCLLSMIPAPTLDARGVRGTEEERTAGLTELVVEVARSWLNVSCVGECSRGIDELTMLLSTPEALEAATEVSNKLFKYATDVVGGELLQVTIDRMLSDAHRKCPSSPLYEPSAEALSYEPFEFPEQEESVGVLVMIGLTTACALAAVGFVSLLLRLLVTCRHRRWLRSLPAPQLRMILARQNKVSERESALNEMSASLFRSTEVPLFVRLGMPIIILGNIGFFLSGHLSLGAAVNIVVTFADETLKVENFFTFSIMKSTIQIWNAGGIELAVMILVFSVIWPYTKQFITLFLWFAPPSRVSISRRGSCLLWLDTLAKWSMVDIMSLIVTVAAFRVSVRSPELGFLPKEFYSIDLVVSPLWGLYANMIAQLISQVSSHFIIHYHRRIHTRARVAFDQSIMDQQNSANGTEAEDLLALSNGDEDACKEKLKDHSFTRPHRGVADKLHARPSSDKVVLFGSVAIGALMVVGCVLPTFAVEILGLVGLVVESGQGFEQARKGITVFTVTDMLFGQAAFTGKMGDYFGLGSLSVLLVFSVLVIPIIQGMVLVQMWFSPMTGKRRRHVAIFIETLQAWQYAEVYLLSVIFASWQLGPVSTFMVNTYCEELESLFASMVYYGIIQEEDAQCFRVESSIESGSYVIAAGAVVLALLNTFVMKAAAQYVRDKRYDEDRVLMGVQDSTNTELPEDQRAIARLIRPVPVLFTDTFRWFLVREDEVARDHARTEPGTTKLDDVEGGDVENTTEAATKKGKNTDKNAGTRGLRNSEELEGTGTTGSENKRLAVKAQADDLLADTMADSDFKGPNETSADDEEGSALVLPPELQVFMLPPIPSGEPPATDA